MSHLKMILAYCLVTAWVSSIPLVSAMADGLSAVEQARYDTLKSQAPKWNNVNLSDFLDLKAKDTSRPPEVSQVAEMMVGTKYNPEVMREHRIIIDNFARIFAATYAKNWDEYMVLMARQFFKDGETRKRNFRGDPLMSWPGNAKDFYDNVTSQLGLETMEFTHSLPAYIKQRELFQRKEITVFDTNAPERSFKETAQVVAIKDLSGLAPLLQPEDMIFLCGTEYRYGEAGPRIGLGSILIPTDRGQTVRISSHAISKSPSIRSVLENSGKTYVAMVFRPKAGLRASIPAKIVQIKSSPGYRLEPVTPAWVDEVPTDYLKSKFFQWMGQSDKVLFPDWHNTMVPERTEVENGKVCGIINLPLKTNPAWVHDQFGHDAWDIWMSPCNAEWRAQHYAQRQSESPRPFCWYMESK